MLSVFSSVVLLASQIPTPPKGADSGDVAIIQWILFGLVTVLCMATIYFAKSKVDSVDAVLAKHGEKLQRLEVDFANHPTTCPKANDFQTGMAALGLKIDNLERTLRADVKADIAGLRDELVRLINALEASRRARD